jgi:hypothetical protein
LARAAEQVASQEQSQNTQSSLIEPPPVDPPSPEASAQPNAPAATLTAPPESEAIIDDPAGTPPAETASAPAPPVETDDEPVTTPLKSEKPKAVKLAPKKKEKPRRVEQAKAKKSEEPRVLVPADTEETGDTNPLYGETQSAQSSTVEQPKKRKTLFDLLETRDGQEAPAQQASEEQVATVQAAKPRRTLLAPREESAPQAQAEPTPAGGSGYVAQLASFRTQSEASQEFSRMKSKHPDILGGVSPVVSEVTVAGSKRYRLAVGPMGNRESASRLCSRLIQAGERDCIAKRQ